MQTVRATRAPRDGKTKLHIGRDSLSVPSWGSELEGSFIYAYPGNSTGLGTKSTLKNNASIVFKLTHGAHSFLFMGDAEGKELDDSPSAPQFVEAILLEQPAKLKSTVLKIAHHGSEISSSTAFINAVDPDYVVVTSGRRNFTGVFLPDASTLQRYCDHKPATRILRTDQDDESEGRCASNDADGEHHIIRTNGVRMIVETCSNGERVVIEACSG